jgi:hypothetical protein
MMFNKLRTAVLSAVVGLGALAAMPAHADGLYLNFGGSGPGAGFYVGDGPRHHRDREWRHSRHDFRHRCTPERALWKAERMGVRRARVVDVGRHSISVRGRSHGDRVWLRFGRAPSCPVIG